MDRRILFGGILSAGASVALAVTAAAGGGGGFLPPGTYHFTDTAAYASMQGADGAYASVSIDRGTHHFKLRKGSTMPPEFIPVTGTVVYASFSQPDGGYLGGCWIVPDSDFTVASGLRSASLHTTVPAASNCPGAEAVIGDAGPTPKGGGGGGGLPGPLSISIGWTSLGAITESHASYGVDCAGRHLGQESASQATLSTAQGTLSLVSGSLSSDWASISSSSSNLQSKGTPAANCLI